MTISIIDVACHLPPTKVGRDYFEQYSRPDDPLLRNPMFRAPVERRYAAPTETGIDLIEAAGAELVTRLGGQALHEVDIVLSHIALPPAPLLGYGAEIARRFGARPGTVIDLQNGHCAVFPAMLDMVRPLFAAGKASSALLCVAQNSGRVFTQPGVRTSAHAAIPGDGAAVALVAATEDSSASPILATKVKHFPEYAPDVSIAVSGKRLYWESGDGEMDVAFDNMKAQNIIERGTKLVPDVVTDVCDSIGIPAADIDFLITNQPNRLLLRNWSRALGLGQHQHPDTYDSYGNLFGAGIPVTLDHTIRDGTLTANSVVLLGGFSGAGELAAAAAVHWRPGTNGRSFPSTAGGSQ